MSVSQLTQAKVRTGVTFKFATLMDVDEALRPYIPLTNVVHISPDTDSCRLRALTKLTAKLRLSSRSSSFIAFASHVTRSTVGQAILPPTNEPTIWPHRRSEWPPSICEFLEHLTHSPRRFRPVEQEPRDDHVQDRISRKSIAHWRLPQTSGTSPLWPSPSADKG